MTRLKPSFPSFARSLFMKKIKKLDSFIPFLTEGKMGKVEEIIEYEI